MCGANTQDRDFQAFLPPNSGPIGTICSKAKVEEHM
jgi:hypothetical protein